MDGKCLRWASFLSRPQNTWTIPRVAEVTGSAKSPPGGDTLKITINNWSTYMTTYAPTIVTDPSRPGFPRHVTLPARS